MGDTIFAVSTPPGLSGVAVVRVSGPHAWQSLYSLTKDDSAMSPRVACLKTLYESDGNTILDVALVLGFHAPHSFTGEDCVEYQIHGSPAVIAGLTQALQSIENIRLAEPGEFTRRAFENGKVDLTEAEAINDLIHAHTHAQKQQALMQMRGGLSDIYHRWAEELSRTLAHCEAVIDFPDEDIPDEEALKAHPQIEKIQKQIESHLNDNRKGERLRDGITVAVLGAPNAGKSSLINMLAQRDVAIVSDVAGTTRDVLEVHLDLGGYPVILSDTAGLRHHELKDTKQDSVESEGIRRALNQAAQVDVKVLVFDGAKQVLDSDTLQLIDENALVVVNKTDLFSDENEEKFWVQEFKNRNHPAPIFVSVNTEDNISELIDRLTHHVESLFCVSRETPSLTRQRHRFALEECQQCLAKAVTEQSPELIAESLRMAVRALGRITGQVDVEDLLDIIFRDFCIGK